MEDKNPHVLFISIGPKSDHCLALSVRHWVNFCSCWDLVDGTLACEDSCNLSLSYQLLSVLTFMLLTLEQNKSHIVDVRTSQKPCYHQFLSDPSIWQCFVCYIDKIPWKTVQRFWRTVFHLVLKKSTPETRTPPCSGFCKIGSDSSSKAPPFQSLHSSDCQGENWEGTSEKEKSFTTST